MAGAMPNRRRNHCPTAAAAALLTTVLALGLIPSTSATAPPSCASKEEGGCHNADEALKLKVIAIVAILVASMIGVGLPLFSRDVPALKPDRNAFVIVKAFASGVILATGYMHVLPDSFNDLRSDCLPEFPWKKFPFTAFVAMLSAIITLMVDSYAMAYYKRINAKILGSDDNANGGVRDPLLELKHGETAAHGHDGDGVGVGGAIEAEKEQLLRYKVVAQVLELGIVVHSVVIGLGLGASGNPCTIKPLIAALCFHQMFEGMGLGGCILQGEFAVKVRFIMAFFFSATTPFGIALGIGLSHVYSENSPAALIVEGLLNASSAGLLNYMALVDLLAADFFGPRLQGDMKLQTFAFAAVLCGAGFMSLMAKWA